MKKTVSYILLAMLLMSMFIFAFNIGPIKAQSGTITINPNGSISSPVPANITNSGNVTYTFTGNNYLPIVVNRSNIIINGKGHALQASGSYGFSLVGMSNVTIKNTIIENSEVGIYLNSSSGDVLSGDNVIANSWGIFLYFSSGNVLSGNVMASNTYNFGVYGSALSDFVNHVGTSNLVNGKPVYYLMGQSNIVIAPETYPGGVGYLGLVNCKNVTVRDLTLTGNIQGLLLANTTDSRITDNNVTANGIDGVDLFSSSGDVLSGNSMTNDSYEGVYLYSSTHCTVSGNKVTDNGDCGIYVDSYCNYTTVSGNNIANNDYSGVYLYGSSNCAISGNNIINNGAEGVYLYSSPDCTVSGNNVTDNGDSGVYVDAYCNYTAVSGNNMTENYWYGIYLESSSDNTLSNNNATYSLFGIWLGSSSNNTLAGNNIKNNEDGVIVSSSSNNMISGNSITDNGLIQTIEPELEGGILIGGSSNNNIYGNNVANNLWGVWFGSSSNNTFSENNITSNEVGIALGFYFTLVGQDIQANSSNNSIYHNNFINNTYQAIEMYSRNVWDNGYPSGGNYWSNYQTRYPNATEIDSSGIWNTPYVIDANNTDYYPLMNPCSPPSLLVSISPSSATLYGQPGLFTSNVTGGVPPYSYQWYLNGAPVSGATYSSWNFSEPAGSYTVYLNVTDSVGVTAKSNIASVTVIQVFGVAMKASASKTVVGQGYSLNVTVTVTNNGDYNETFSFAFYANGTAITTLTFTLPVGNSTTTAFTWNTAGFALGNYTMSTVLVGAPAGFNFAYGTVKVTIPGDINGDGVVNGKDLHLLALYWLETVPPAPANVDIGGYGVISGKDLHILVQNWLE